MAYLLDTCAILFIAEATNDLSSETQQLVNEAPAQTVYVSAISLAELSCLHERGRIKLAMHWRKWWNELLTRTGWTCLPVTSEIVAEAYTLPEFQHRDPADRFLIAAARLERLTIITTDRKILDYPHVTSLS